MNYKKILYTYLRVPNNGTPKKDGRKSLKRVGVIAAGLSEDNKVFISGTLCSENDKFSATWGVNKAIGRLKKELYDERVPYNCLGLKPGVSIVKELMEALNLTPRSDRVTQILSEKVNKNNVQRLIKDVSK